MLMRCILINIFVFVLFLFIIVYFVLLTVISENGQIVSIINDYECVTCHRVFQSQDVSYSFSFFFEFLFYI